MRVTAEFRAMDLLDRVEELGRAVWRSRKRVRR
jgi:hypothetical protein